MAEDSMESICFEEPGVAGKDDAVARLDIE